MRQVKLMTIFFAYLLGLISPSAKAILIDQGGSVLDTDTHLEWLKLTATDAMSANTAIATYGAEGWGLANGTEYKSLFDVFFPTYTDIDGNGYESVYAGSVLFDQGTYFADMLGLTQSKSTGIGASYGFYEGDDGLLHVGGVFHGAGAKNLYRDRQINYDKYRTSAHSNAGIFMVKAVLVPEPASVLLLGLGLASLGFARRKIQLTHL